MDLFYCRFFDGKTLENDGRIEKVIFDLIQRPLCRLTLASQA